ncbi:MAG: hypothetical protein ACOYLD_00695, partial [Anaerohalosphaeraceae bacterium]
MSFDYSLHLCLGFLQACPVQRAAVLDRLSSSIAVLVWDYSRVCREYKTQLTDEIIETRPARRRAPCTIRLAVSGAAAPETPKSANEMNRYRLHNSEAQAIIVLAVPAKPAV